MVDAAHGEVHGLVGEVVGGDVQVPGLVVLGDGLGGLQGDVAVEVSQRGGQRAGGSLSRRLCSIIVLQRNSQHWLMNQLSTIGDWPRRPGHILQAARAPALARLRALQGTVAVHTVLSMYYCCLYVCTMEVP